MAVDTVRDAGAHSSAEESVLTSRGPTFVPGGRKWEGRKNSSAHLPFRWPGSLFPGLCMVGARPPPSGLCS